jgi:hypothetical protein
MIQLKLCMAAIVVVSLFTGCARYSAHALPGVETVMATHMQRQGNIHVGTKFLSSSECKSTFGSSKVMEHYQPVVIAITNNSEKVVVFRKDQMSHIAYPAELVAADCKFNTMCRAASYGIASLFCWPMVIPAIVDGIGSSNANNQMASDYAIKEIQNAELQPGMHLVGVAFLDKMNRGEGLTIKLFDDNRQLIDTCTFLL